MINICLVHPYRTIFELTHHLGQIISVNGFHSVMKAKTLHGVGSVH